MLPKKQLLKHPSGNIEILVVPSLHKNLNLSVQNASINWGDGHHIDYEIKSEQLISLPYVFNDWQNVKGHSQLKKLSIHFQLPNAVSPASLSLSTDPRLLSLRFLKISLDAD